jgi:hypothetical protein
MDWANEEYVRLYTRETADDLELSWEAIALWRAMLTKFDRAGVLSVRNGWPSVARLVRMPIDVVERAGAELVADGRVRVTERGFVAPNYVEAQTASKSDRIRQKESRDRRRADAMSQHRETSSTLSQNVTPGHELSRDVTTSHAPSQNVTLTSADPLLCDAPLPGADVTRAYNPVHDLGKLADSTWRRLSEARVALAAELGLKGIHPLTPITPGSYPRAYRDLRERIREEGMDAPQVCARVLESLIADARKNRSVEWVGEKATTEGAWRTAKERVPKWTDVKLPAGTKRTFTNTMRLSDGAVVRVTEDAAGNVLSVEPVVEQTAGVSP